MLRNLLNFLLGRSPNGPEPLYDLPDDIGVLAELPPEIEYLVGPAFRYGRHQFESSMFKFLDSATKSEIADLKRLASIVRKNQHYDVVNDFLDKYSMSDHTECECLYSLFGVMDHAGLSFD